MLIFPSANARRFATEPEEMAMMAAFVGVLSVFVGLFTSLQWDTPAGPSIVEAASVFFILSALPAVSLEMLRSSFIKKNTLNDNRSFIFLSIIFMILKGGGTERYHIG